MVLLNNKKGFSLVEVLLAGALLSLISAALVGTMIQGEQGTALSGDYQRAVLLADECTEAVRDIRNSAWNILPRTADGLNLDYDNNIWGLTGSATTETIDIYDRTMAFEEVCRDVNNVIVDCPGGEVDLYTVKVTCQVAWNSIADVDRTIEKTTYLTNWDSINWTQTDWVDGDGQAIWSDEEMYDSDDGNIDVSIAGETKVQGSIEQSCGDYSWSFTSPGEYNYDSNKIEIISSIIQLKQGTGCSGSPNTCTTFVDQAACQGQTGCSWDLSDCSGTANTCSPYDQSTCNLCGCTYDAAGPCAGTCTTCDAIGDEPSCGNQTGCSWTPSGGACADTVEYCSGITSPSACNGCDICRWQGGNCIYNTSQSLTCTDLNQTECTTCNSACDYTAGGSGACSGTCTTCDILVDDTSCGNQDGCSWDADDCSGTAALCSTYDETGCATCGCSWDPADCYGTPLACDTLGDLTSCQGQTGCVWSGDYATDSPTVNPTVAYTPTAVDAWTAFSETATKNGGEIYYQLSDDDGTTWQYWNGSAWAVATATDYNTATDINTNIATFSTTNSSIMFKAFLESDGIQQVQLDNLQLIYKEKISATDGSYNIAEDIESEFDLGTYNETQFDTDHLELTATGQSNGTGTYSSTIFDTDGDATLQTFSWIPAAPYGKELLDDGAIETAYSTGNIDMTNNQILFHLNETLGATSFTDSSGNAYDAACSASTCPVAGNSGRFNAALDFDGANDYIAVTQDLSQWLGGTATASYWLKTTQVGGLDSYVSPGIMGVENISDDNDIFWGWLDDTGRIGFTVGNSLVTKSQDPINDDQWHHVFMTRNQASGYAELWVDGQSQGSNTVDTGLKTTPFYDIGRIDDTGGTPRYFDGLLDEVVIWDVELTSTEAQALYQRGALDIKYQVRTCDDQSCDTEEFIGPDGTTADYYQEFHLVQEIGKNIC